MCMRTSEDFVEMKKFILFSMLTAALTVMALRPGDMIGKPEFRLKWIDCTPFKVGELTKEEQAVMPPLRILVFMFTRSENSSQIINMLEQIRLKYRGKVMVAAVTPDTEHDAKIFHKANPDVRVRLAVDSERKLTPLFMAGSMLYPMGFICNAEGKVLWNGEAVDLAEAVEKIFRNQSNVQDNRKVSLLIDDMQQRMRTGEIRPLKQVADKIFKIDPVNPTALRMLLFVMESSGDIDGAWKLISERIKASPAALRLYYTALDMIRRNPRLRNQLPQIISGFYRQNVNSTDFIAFTETVLLSFSSDAEALEVVFGQMFGKKKRPELSAAENARYDMVRARLRYLVGDLNGAMAYQQKAVDAFKSAPQSRGTVVAQAQLEFYRKLKELRSKVY